MTSFVLKIIAAVSMLIDHVGVVLYPDAKAFRIVGRLAYPIFAYFVAEGFRYTRSRLKYFLKIFIVGALCQVLAVVMRDKFSLDTLLAYAFSIVLLAAADCVKKASRDEKSGYARLYEKLTKRRMTNGFERRFSTAAFVTLAFLIFLFTKKKNFSGCLY